MPQRRDDPRAPRPRPSSAGSSGPAAGPRRPPCWPGTRGLPGPDRRRSVSTSTAGASPLRAETQHVVELLTEASSLADAARPRRRPTRRPGSLAHGPGRAVELPRAARQRRRDARLEGCPAADQGLAGQGRPAAPRHPRSARRSGQQDLAERQQFQELPAGCGTRPSSTRPSSSSTPAAAARGCATRPARRLAVYARDPKADEDAGAWPRRSPTCSPDAEKRRIVDGCYDLLLMLSEAVEPAAGLKILDRAAAAAPRSRPRPTTSAAPSAWPARRRRRPGSARRSWPPAGPRHRAGPLPDRPRAAAPGQWDEAISSLEAAVRLDPDQTAAQLLLAICEYNVQPRRLGEAPEPPQRLPPEPSRPGRALPAARPGPRRAGEPGLARIDPRPPASEHGTPDARPTGLRGRRGRLRRGARSAADRRPPLRAAGQPGRHVPPGRPVRRVARRPRGGHPAPAAAVPGLRDAGPAGTSGRAGSTRRRAPSARPSSGRPTPPSGPRSIAAGAGFTANRRDATCARSARPRCRPRGGDPARAGRSEAKASDHVERARLLFGGARIEEALAACAAALALVPDHPAAHQLRISVPDGPEAVRRGARARATPTSAGEHADGRGPGDPRPGPVSPGRTTPARSPTTPGPSS